MYLLIKAYNFLKLFAISQVTFFRSILCRPNSNPIKPSWNDLNWIKSNRLKNENWTWRFNLTTDSPTFWMFPGSSWYGTIPTNVSILPITQPVGQPRSTRHSWCNGAARGQRWQGRPGNICNFWQQSFLPHSLLLLIQFVLILWFY